MFISSWIFHSTLAQNNTTFSPANQFPIPSNNGIVKFAVNGSYSQVTLENNSWTFENLIINGSIPIQNLLVSAENSNVTIFLYSSFGGTPPIQALNYAVEGSGKQIFNFGPQGHVPNVVDWTVFKTIDRRTVFLTPGTDWTFSPNGTIVVNGATGNFTIFYFPSLEDNSLNSNLPFYEQHSVAITTSAIVTIIIILTVVIALRNKKYLTPKNPQQNLKVENGKISTLKDKEKP